ncbi:pentatricopeptide repeat-containing protein At5g03800-like [Vicia villosa]|uniref:pentatricopeptide repeat-containing protein At5g03800-like n=1 Tax=Vicia villosa TaxID=3911 RepID=UPI00273CE2C6|nr:pentatricopeptide repeat-containing protein At5g03800-like [Vicia villosa]XP_058739121.1 pentatricopeptide repeat-containing protein At5g03800-like [Vicia villosa]XP_058739122.1 pentatricopeptide repeat-containing protein At5g03800-like [Vicia villosa]
MESLLQFHPNSISSIPHHHSHFKPKHHHPLFHFPIKNSKTHFPLHSITQTKTHSILPLPISTPQQSPIIVSYSSLISVFSKSNREPHAIFLFLHMLTASPLRPHGYTYVAVLTACTRILYLQFGLQLHAAVIKTGYLNSVFVSNALMSFYLKCGFYQTAFKVFDEMGERDIVSWNTVISCAVNGLMYDTAFQLFRDMLVITDSLKVDYFTLSAVLTACAMTTGLVMEGKQVHAIAVKVGLETELNVGNALIGFYMNCGSLDGVVCLFQRMGVRDVITWTEMVRAYMEFGYVDLGLKIFDEMPERNCVTYNAVLSGFCRNGEGLKAMELFVRMVEEGMELSDFSLSGGINACSLLADYGVCKQMHGFAIKFGFGSNVCVEGALLEMYTRCGRMVDAKKMFSMWEELEKDSSVVWTSMMCGFARNGKPKEAISLYHLGHSKGKLIMDEVVLSTMLGLCGTVGYHDMGKQIHCQVLKFGFHSEVQVGNAVVSMYFKCGNVDDAIKMFSGMSSTDIVSWNILISGYVMHRQGDKALEIWSKMREEGITPDEVTFILIISAYRQTDLNLVDDCRSLFDSMRTVYHIEPTSQHYASFISVLGHWGLLEEALETINKMPFKPSAFVWRALLDGCRLHKNTMIEKWTVKNILALEPKDPSTYILVSNLYSSSGRWDCSEMTRENMRKKGFHKYPAQSWIICQKKMHSFYARDRSHPQDKDIYSGLEILIFECLKMGYEPDTRFVLHEVEEHQKKIFLFHHSSKLAATYGILMTKPGKPIRIVKNILLCGDCHTFMKYVSIVTKRDIFLRDSSGFHCFSNGQCSCKDRW